MPIMRNNTSGSYPGEVATCQPPPVARPLALFVHTHSWLQDQVLRVAPPTFDVKFARRDQIDLLASLLPRADFLVTAYLPAEWVRQLKRCRLVQHQGVGYDGVDIEALEEAGIPFALTTEGTVVGVAEHTILLILALYKQLVLVHENMRGGRYDPVAWRPNSHLLFGKSVGIIGFGRIGKRVAELAHVFGAKILYADIVRADKETERRMSVTYRPFNELLAEADIVSTHTPLTANTRELFSAEVFAQMKRGALFVNTSRGGTYDMNALYEALRTGQVGAAGLDVFNPEPPPPEHPILRLPNVICTPHMATGTVEAHRQKAIAQFANFERVLRGERPNNLAAGKSFGSDNLHLKGADDATGSSQQVQCGAAPAANGGDRRPDRALDSRS